MQVLPQNPTVKTGTQQSFTASITNGSGTVVWAVTPNDGAHGAIDGNGMYTAPNVVPTSPSVTITATLPGSSGLPGSSVATITKGTTTVSVSPPLSSVTPSQSLQLSAGGVNTTNSSVTWLVDNAAVSGTLGSVSPNGLTLLPNGLAAGMHSVTATSTDGSGAHGSASVAVSSYAGTFSWRNDTSISGVNSQELVLSPASVSISTFGKLFSCAVDGEIYAQPLYVANLNITSKATQQAVTANVILVATENDSLYAFDADASPCVTYWQDSFLPAGEEAVSSADVGTTDITPAIGITGTPVIDPKTNTLYVVSKSKQFTVSPLVYAQRLHAIDITTGLERPSSPVVLAASAPGTGDGSNGNGMIPFDPLRENQRAGLLLLNEVVYIAFASHGDNGLYHGWVLAYGDAFNAQPLKLLAAFNDTPNGTPSEGGIWLGGAAPSVDPDTGYIYVASAKGAFDTTLNGSGFPNLGDFGESVLRLDPKTLSVLDYFTPCDQGTLSMDDDDMGPGGVVPLPDSVGNPTHPHLLLAGDKAGDLYLLDRTNLGHYTGIAGGNCPDTAPVQELTSFAATYETPLVWTDAKNTTRLYLTANNGLLGLYPVSAGSITTSPTSQSLAKFSGREPSPVVSANNGASGVLWLIDGSNYTSSTGANGPAILRAYDATDVATELYDSTEVSPRDTAGTIVKFSVPTVANGKVYVGTQSELDVYGLLP